jgi:hypothetical protein
MSAVLQYWPNKTLTNIMVQRIVQIRYYLGDVADGLVEIWATNTITKDQYYWMSVPASYKDHLHRMFYRLDLLCECINVEPKSTDLGEAMHKNLGYIDKVLDGAWDEAAAAEKANGMDTDWRSKILDAWLCIEGLVGRHDPESVGAYIEQHGQECLDSDPTEIGELCILSPYSVLFT